MNNENNKFFINGTETSDLTLNDNLPLKSNVLYEDTSKRGKDTKHFRLKNGNFMAVMYDHPVHKIDPDTGKYIDITSETSETETNIETLINNFKVRLPKVEDTGHFVTVEKDNTEIAWRFVPKQKTYRKKSMAVFSRRPKRDLWEIGDYPSVKYEKADTNIDLQYDISDDGIKESIILSKNPECKIFSFQVRFKGLIPMLSEDNKTVFLLRDDEDLGAELPEMKIPPAFMKDANEAFCDDMVRVGSFLLNKHWKL